MQSKEITEKIRQLEIIYAESLANDADYKKLNAIWEKIKSLRKQLLFTEFFENISDPTQITTK